MCDRSEWEALKLYQDALSAGVDPNAPKA
jgi:hypothetical protein